MGFVQRQLPEFIGTATRPVFVTPAIPAVGAFPDAGGVISCPVVTNRNRAVLCRPGYFNDILDAGGFIQIAQRQPAWRRLSLKHTRNNK